MILRRRSQEGSRGAATPKGPGIEPALDLGVTVVGRGARVEGKLVSAGSIRIDGQAKGEIAARDDVILSSHSQVEADIQAENVMIGGTMKGKISARTRTELAQSARVEGKLRSKVLVVRDGALLSGRSRMDIDDVPDEADELAYPEDDLQMAYEQAVRRAATWYRSRLFGPDTELSGPDTEPDKERAAVPDGSRRIRST